MLAKNPHMRGTVLRSVCAASQGLTPSLRPQNSKKRLTSNMKILSSPRVIAAILIPLSCIFGALQLKISAVISELSFIGLISVSMFCGLIIFFSDRITQFSLSKLEITLKDMKETEASVKELGKAILAVVEASSHSIMLESFDEKVYTESVNRLKKLIA